jgi:hypothetical protein
LLVGLEKGVGVAGAALVAATTMDFKEKKNHKMLGN